MSTTDQYLALLLAAEKDPSVRSLEDFAEAEALLERNEAFQTAFETEKAFASAYPELFAEAGLTAAQKRQMIATLQADRGSVHGAAGAGPVDAAPAGKQIAFPTRWLTRAAGIAAVFLLGVFFGPALFPSGSSRVQVAGSPADDLAFREFAARWVEEGINLDMRDNDFDDVVKWLERKEAPAVMPRHPLEDIPTMGCKVFDWNGYPVSLVCFKIQNGEKIHLFFSPLMYGALPEGAAVPKVSDFEGRSTAMWKSGGASYVLVAHNIEQTLCPDLLQCCSGEKPVKADRSGE